MKTPHSHPQSATPEQLMLARLQSAFSDPAIHRACHHDLLLTLRAIGYGVSRADHIVINFISDALTAKSLKALEKRWNKVFKPELPKIHRKLTSRAQIVYGQVFPWIRKAAVEGDLGTVKLLDFGTGDGQIADALRRSGMRVTGIDVVDYRAKGVDISFQKFDGRRSSLDDGEFDVVLATNVFHHSAENELAEREACRLLKRGGLFVVIETVPIGTSIEAVKKDHERTFVSDYFYNRILHPGANVPVPGTYETAGGWNNRFRRWGKPIYKENLGIDIPVIQDYHWLGVFKKK